MPEKQPATPPPLPPLYNARTAEAIGAIGALHDQLERSGVLAGDAHLRYLMYRVRRDHAAQCGDAPSRAHWQGMIEAMAAVPT